MRQCEKCNLTAQWHVEIRTPCACRHIDLLHKNDIIIMIFWINLNHNTKKEIGIGRHTGGSIPVKCEYD